MPAKKQDYERVFNELLGTDIKWSKLNLEDLIQLAVLFENPELLLKRLGVSEELRKTEAKKRIADVLLELAKDWPGPAAQALRKLIGS